MARTFKSDHITPHPIDDNVQLLSGLILTPVVAEFGFKPPYLSLALNIGLFAGAVIWGIGCDVWGRRWSFNVTLFLTGAFGLASGGAGNFVTFASLFAVCGFGVGGNLPVDSAVFLGQRLRPCYSSHLTDRTSISPLRPRTCVPPVSAHGHVRMVVSRATPWELGEPLPRLAKSGNAEH